MMAFALYGLILAGIALDLLTTDYVLRRGGREVNPLLAWLMRKVGRLQAQILAHLIFAGVLWLLLPRLRTSSLVVIATVLWLVVAWNVRTIVRLRRARR